MTLEKENYQKNLNDAISEKEKIKKKLFHKRGKWKKIKWKVKSDGKCQKWIKSRNNEFKRRQIITYCGNK